MGTTTLGTLSAALVPAPEWAIVLPAGAGETERFAAKELAKYLGRITGAAIDISAAPPAAAKTILRLGNQLDPRLAGRPDDERSHVPIASASAKSRAVSPPASCVLSTRVTFE